MPGLALIPEVVAALEGEDAERCLGAAIEVLKAHGLPESARTQAAWLELKHGERILAFAIEAGVEAPDAATRVQLRQLLTMAMARSAEQQELRRVRERLEMLSEASFEGIILHIDGVPIEVNKRMCEMTGYTYEEFLEPGAMQRGVAPEDLPEAIERIRNRVEGEFVVTSVRKDGTRFRSEFRTKQTRLGDRPVRVVALRDVSERERAAAMLRESETRLRQLMEAAFDCVVLGRDGVVVDVGGSAEAFFGCSRAELIGMPVLDLVAPGAREHIAQRMREGAVGSTESTARTAQGELIPVTVVTVQSTLDGEPVRASALRDLRPARRLEQERRRLEQQVERSQRLESLGALAGGIAHDFNNLLVGILGGAELLLYTLTDPEQRANAEAIHAAGQQAASLTKQMLAYAGRRDLRTVSPIDLSALLHELHTLLEAALSKKARVVFDLAKDSIVAGERATLTQVLMNLLTNASDALEDRPGTIFVSTRHLREPDARWDDALGATVRPGDWVLIEVRDTGVGMTEPTRARIFEPFFSTKPRGHGLGLGACLSIVSAHSGAILVESEPQRGSTFSVLLPAAKGQAQTKAERRAPDVRPCRVLIIDDEALVRTHLRRLLELRGFAVYEAESGASGLAAIAQREPDLVVLDLRLPDLDGIEVARRLRASGSRVPLVLCSGTIDNTSARALEPGMVQAILEKPFSTDELISAIERARTSAAELHRAGS